MTTFEDRPNYWEASRRVRETWARFELGNLLFWAFDPEVLTQPEDEFESFVAFVRDRVAGAEPAWRPAMDALRGIPVKSLRGDLKEAFKMIRELARDVATNQPTGSFPMRIRLYLFNRPGDREGRPVWHLSGRLRDGLVWTAVKLFSEVPRSLIRPCSFAGCTRVYVAGKNQRYCLGHQAEAARQTQRRAENAHRQRAKTRRPQ